MVDPGADRVHRRGPEDIRRQVRQEGLARPLRGGRVTGHREAVAAYAGLVPDTGFPTQDAQTDFSRARRRQALSRLARRLRREPDDVNVILPFNEVVEALGWRGRSASGFASYPLIPSWGPWTAPATSTGDFAPRPGAYVADGRASPRQSGAGNPCRRSTCTGSATSTSSATAIIECRSHVRSAWTASRLTSPRWSRPWARSSGPA